MISVDPLPLLGDLRERMLASEAKMLLLADDARGPMQAVRSAGKAAGLRIAISHLDEAIRQLAREGLG